MARKRKKRTITDESGQSVEGTVITVDETTERWTEASLSDGTTFRIKVVIDEVVRIDGQTDNEGNPVYTIVSHNVISDVQSLDSIS